MVRSPLNTKNTTADTNMTLFEQFQELKTKSDAAKCDLSNFLSTNKRQILKDVAAQLKAIPGMNKLVIYGYTPGFNDGDACTHSSECLFRDYHFQEFAEQEDYSFFRMMNVPEEVQDEGEPWNWEGFENVNTYSDADEPKVRELIQLLDYLVEQIEYTNYLALFDFTTEETDITFEEYDCGH